MDGMKDLDIRGITAEVAARIGGMDLEQRTGGWYQRRPTLTRVVVTPDMVRRHLLSSVWAGCLDALSGQDREEADKAMTAELALAYELAVETAYGEVRDAYASYTQEYHRYQSLQGAVKAATDAVTISQDLYKNGLKDFNNVLDAQRSRLQLEEELVISRGQITMELIRLYRALGGGLAAPDDENLPTRQNNE